jgi:hypothetical protein
MHEFLIHASVALFIVACALAGGVAGVVVTGTVCRQLNRWRMRRLVRRIRFNVVSVVTTPVE